MTPNPRIPFFSRGKETNPKDAIGCTKPPLSVIPLPPLYEVAAGLLEGACKYRRHNYRRAGIRNSIYYDGVMRHLAAWWEGQDIDPDSGIHHVSKAIACLLVLRDAQMADMATDDRPPVVDPHWMEKVQERVTEVLKRHPNPLPPYTETDIYDKDEA